MPTQHRFFWGMENSDLFCDSDRPWICILLCKQNLKRVRFLLWFWSVMILYSPLLSKIFWGILTVNSCLSKSRDSARHSRLAQSREFGICILLKTTFPRSEKSQGIWNLHSAPPTRIRLSPEQNSAREQNSPPRPSRILLTSTAVKERVWSRLISDPGMIRRNRAEKQNANSKFLGFFRCRH